LLILNSEKSISDTLPVCPFNAPMVARYSHVPFKPSAASFAEPHYSSTASHCSRLAAELSVSERTVYRDLAELATQGVRGEAGIGYVLKPGFSSCHP
jgi:hypothetical protein